MIALTKSTDYHDPLMAIAMIVAVVLTLVALSYMNTKL